MMQTFSQVHKYLNIDKFIVIDKMYDPDFQLLFEDKYIIM